MWADLNKELPFLCAAFAKYYSLKEFGPWANGPRLPWSVKLDPKYVYIPDPVIIKVLWEEFLTLKTCSIRLKRLNEPLGLRKKKLWIHQKQLEAHPRIKMGRLPWNGRIVYK